MIVHIVIPCLDRIVTFLGDQLPTYYMQCNRDACDLGLQRYCAAFQN